jgi:KDO2-lipid IV(A) lauroyltransferase
MSSEPGRPIPWRHRAEYALGRALQEAVCALPEGAADAFGGALGSLVHAPLGIRRGVVAENLRGAFPDADAAWIDRVTRTAYRHLGREATSMLRLARLDAAALVARSEFAGDSWAVLEAARAEGRGVILYSGHYGNWELAAAAIAARGVPFVAVAKRMSNRRVDARLTETRARLGVDTIDMADAPRGVPRALRSGRVVGMVADQDARASGVWAPFFGRPASTHRGPALFALRFGAPIVAGFAQRLPGRPARYRISLERVPVTASGDLEADVRGLAAELNARLEAVVRADPGQYFWVHKRWKTLPPAELAALPPV